MATVTGLTADRMLAIEAASVVDGDIVGDNLILTQHGGTQINAGNVRGPAGPAGPIGADLGLLAAVPILQVGHSGQIRAGRQLTVADFTDLGLAAPLGLWNLSSLADSSGNGRNLLNKGAVALGPGINGLPNTAAKLYGDSAQVLYLPAIANDPLALRTGSIGCWFKTSKRSSDQALVSKSGTAAAYYMFELGVSGGNQLSGWTSSNNTNVDFATGTTDVADDLWHFGVFTFDGSANRLYVDGILEATTPVNYPASGPTTFVPLNIGGRGGDAGTVPIQSHWGSIDEAFVTGDILSDDQIRNLYCVRIPHTLPGAPTRLALNVRRYRRGASLTVADFTTAPLRLHNFSAGSLGDEGSNAVALLNNGGALPVAGVDGIANNAYNYNMSQNLYATDTGMPSGLSPRSYGGWFKVVANPTSRTVMSWGTPTGGPVIGVNNTGNLFSINYGIDQINGPFVADGRWHHVVVTESNTGDSGVKRKIYLDGKLIGFSGLMGNILLGGLNSFRVGGIFNGEMAWNFFGQVDSVFVTGYMLTSMEVQKLYMKGTQPLPPSPKNVGDHIEAITATDILATFDMLDVGSKIDLTVAP